MSVKLYTQANVNPSKFTEVGYYHRELISHTLSVTGTLILFTATNGPGGGTAELYDPLNLHDTTTDAEDIVLPGTIGDDYTVAVSLSADFMGSSITIQDAIDIRLGIAINGGAGGVIARSLPWEQVELYEGNIAETFSMTTILSHGNSLLGGDTVSAYFLFSDGPVSAGTGYVQNLRFGISYIAN